MTPLGDLPFAALMAGLWPVADRLLISRSAQEAEMFAFDSLRSFEIVSFQRGKLRDSGRLYLWAPFGEASRKG